MGSLNVGVDRSYELVATVTNRFTSFSAVSRRRPAGAFGFVRVCSDLFWVRRLVSKAEGICLTMQSWSEVSVRARGVARLRFFQVGSAVQGFSTLATFLDPYRGRSMRTLYGVSALSLRLGR